MSPSAKQRAVRALRSAMAEEHRAKDRALEAGDVDEAIAAWLQAMHATRRASHAVRSGTTAKPAGETPDSAASSPVFPQT